MIHLWQKSPNDEIKQLYFESNIHFTKLLDANKCT